MDVVFHDTLRLNRFFSFNIFVVGQEKTECRLKLRELIINQLDEELAYGDR